MDAEGSLKLAVLGLEEGGLLEVTEGLRLGLGEGFDVDGTPEGAAELRTVGDGEGLVVLGCSVGKTTRFAAEGTGVTFFLQYHLGLRRHRLHRSAFFLSFRFFFRSSARFSLHFFRILSRRPGG